MMGLEVLAMYTPEHYEVMEALEPGLHWHWHQVQHMDDILHFLDEEGIAAPRADLHPDLWVLTEHGKQVLWTHREECARKKQEQAKQADAETKRLQERLEDYANEERRYRGTNKITIVASLLSFALGLLAEHFCGIIGAVQQICTSFR